MYPIKFSTCPMSVRARSARWCSRFKSTTSAQVLGVKSKREQAWHGSSLPKSPGN